MLIKRSVAACLVLVFLASSLAWAGPAAAAPDSSRDGAGQFCQSLREEGFLAEQGVTVGECVNIVSGFAGISNPNATNFIAGICGSEFGPFFTGTTNKGQCIQALDGEESPSPS